MFQRSWDAESEEHSNQKKVFGEAAVAAVVESSSKAGVELELSPPAEAKG